MFKGKCLPRVRICAPVYGGKAALQQLRRRQSDGVSSALERRQKAGRSAGPVRTCVCPDHGKHALTSPSRRSTFTTLEPTVICLPLRAPVDSLAFARALRDLSMADWSASKDAEAGERPTNWAYSRQQLVDRLQFSDYTE